MSGSRNCGRAYTLPENADKGVINVDGIMAERLHLESAIRKLRLTPC